MESLPQPGRALWIETVADDRPHRKSEVEPRPDASLRDDSSGTIWQDLGSVPVSLAESSNGIDELIHDMRNLAAAIEIYSELLNAPGVLSSCFQYLAGDLRLVSGRSRSLLERMALLVDAETPLPLRAKALPRVDCSSIKIADDAPGLSSLPSSKANTTNLLGWQDRSKRTAGLSTSAASKPIESLAAEVRANREILAALAGPAISIGLSIEGCNRPVSILSEDLTRVLINLAGNAAQAMPCGGHLQIALTELSDRMLLTFTDTGSGIPESALEAIFASGYTTRVRVEADQEDSYNSNAWPAQHRGLGLAIVRSIVMAAGGNVWAANRPDTSAHLDGEQWPGEACRKDAAMRPSAETSLHQPSGNLAANRESTSGSILTIEFPISRMQGKCELIRNDRNEHCI